MGCLKDFTSPDGSTISTTARCFRRSIIYHISFSHTFYHLNFDKTLRKAATLLAGFKARSESLGHSSVSIVLLSNPCA